MNGTDIPKPSPLETTDAADCAQRLRVVADSRRFAILRHLARKPRPVSDLARAVGIERSLLSHHLRILREAGLVSTERNGKTIVYSLVPGLTCGPASGGAPDRLEFGCCSLHFDRKEDWS